MTCRACGSARLAEVIDLGDQYLSDFRPDPLRPPRYPLRLVWCQDCTLAQLEDTVPPEYLYHSRYSFKSGVNPGIVADLADVVRHALAARPDPRRWLDIASNDGTLLSQIPTGIHRTGIDPLMQFASEANRHADRLIVALFDPRYFDDQFDVITTVSMFYDVPDPVRFCRDVASVLAPDGVWVIQQNYLPTMLAAGSVDNISHEHLAYHTLSTLSAVLDQAGLEIVDVALNPVNGGCFRTMVARRGTRPVAPSVAAQLEVETAALADPETVFATFAGRARRTLAALADLVHAINACGQRVWVYGAGTRGGTLWQAAGLDHHELPYVVDRNPEKVGRWMSAIGAPIISEQQMRADPPDYLLVGPWWFAEQFAQREAAFLTGGGKMIVPLPELRVADAVSWRCP